MIKKTKKHLFAITMILCIAFCSVLQTENSISDHPKPFFNISILAPNNLLMYYIASYISEQFPYIGISIDVLDLTSWSQIYPRTWDYQGPYPIPSYENGGYDVLFVGWGWRGFNWNPTGVFDTAGIVPFGDNFYQYSNPEMDLAIINYTSTYRETDRIEYAKNIQALLYEDLPQITIIYPRDLYVMTEGFNGWDGMLWLYNYQQMENWSIGSDTEFHYAVPADFVDFHIYQCDSVYDAYWLNQIYNGLIERQPETHQWGNRLATSFTSTNGLVWNIEINPNAKWADGTALTAYDVNYSYNLLINPDFNSNDAIYWKQYISNTSINIINDYQLEITFLQPYIFQESLLAVDLIPKHIWEVIDPANHEAQASIWAVSDPSKLFGAGPYRLANYDSSSDIIHLEVNEYFDDWSGITPYFDDIYFEFYTNKVGALSALASGEVDMVDAQFSPQFDEIADIPGITYELVPYPGTQEIGINMEHPYLGTGEACPIAKEDSANHIRKAISHIIPREIIIDSILDGIGAPGVTAMPEAVIGYDNSLEPFEHNIALAKDEMRAAGFEYPEDRITPTTIILGLSVKSIISSLGLLGSAILVIRYRKKRSISRYA